MILRGKPPRRFTKVPNSIIEDARLSLEASATLTFLLSRPDDWEPRLDHLAGPRKIGRDKAYSIMKQLMEAGYAARRQKRTPDGRRLGAVEYVVSADPEALKEFLLTENQEAEGLPPENPEADVSLLPGSLLTENPDARITTERELTTEAAAGLLTENQEAEGLLLARLLAASGRPHSNAPAGLNDVTAWQAQGGDINHLLVFIRRRRSAGAKTWRWWIKGFEAETASNRPAPAVGRQVPSRAPSRTLLGEHYDLIHQAVGEVAFVSWFGGVAASPAPCGLLITAPNRLFADRIRDQYRDKIVKATGEPVEIRVAGGVA